MASALGTSMIDERWYTVVRLLGDLDKDAGRLIAGAAYSVPGDEDFDRNDVHDAFGWREPHLSVTVAGLTAQGFLTSNGADSFTPTPLARSFAEVLGGLDEEQMVLRRTRGCDSTSIEFLSYLASRLDDPHPLRTEQLDVWWTGRDMSVQNMGERVGYMAALGLVEPVITFGRREPMGVSITTDGIVLERAATVADVGELKRSAAAALEGQEVASPGELAERFDVPLPLMQALFTQLGVRDLLDYQESADPSGGWAHNITPRLPERSGWI